VLQIEVRFGESVDKSNNFQFTDPERNVRGARQEFARHIREQVVNARDADRLEHPITLFRRVRQIGH